MDICLENVGRIYSWDWAIRGVDATIGAGEIVCVLGENGSGKTTLLKMIGGILRPTEGCVRIGDRRVRRGAVVVRRNLLLLHPDQPMLGANVVQHLGAAISLFECDRLGIETQAAYWLQRLDVPASTGANDNRRLSRGQTMKLWMATLFTLRPTIWLLDEPHQSGLDALGIEILEQEILAHAAAGGIVIFTSQWPRHAVRLATRLFVLHEADLRLDGPVDGFAGCRDMADESLAAILRQLDPDESDLPKRATRDE